MRQFALAAVVFVAAVGLTQAQEAEKALKALEGNYSVKSLEEDGKPAPKDVLDAVEVVEIKGDTMTVKLKGGKSEPAQIKVDPSKTPGWIDITPETKAEKKKTMPGLYKFDKGELTIVFVETGDRPKEFKSAGKDMVMIVVVKKDK